MGSTSERNAHLHIVFYERPAAKIAQKDGSLQWDFAVVDYKKYSSGWKRPGYIYARANDRTLNHRDWPKNARERFADIVNRKLSERGIAQKYDSRSYEDMGLGIEPLPRISRGEFLKEKSGRETAAGALIAKRWDRMQGVIDRLYGKMDTSPTIEDRFDKQVKRWGRIGSSFGHMALAHRYQWRVATRLSKYWKGEAAIAAFVGEKILSRVDPPIRKEGPRDPELGPITEYIDKQINDSVRKALIHRNIAAASFDVLTRLETKSLKENKSINYIYGDTLPNGQPNPKRLMDEGLYRLAQSLVDAAKIGKGQEFKDSLFKKRAHPDAAPAAPMPQQGAAPQTPARKRPSDQLDASDLEFYKVVDNILSAPNEQKAPTTETKLSAREQNEDATAPPAIPPAPPAPPSVARETPQPQQPRRPAAPTRTTYLATKPTISA